MRKLWILSLCLTFLGLNSCKEASRTKVLKLAHGLAVSHPVHGAMVFLADKVAEKSDGQLQIDIYPSEQLGKERELVELLQIGSIAITKVSSGVLENFSPSIRALGMPYVFRSRQHQFNVLDGPIGQKLLEEPTKYRLKGLCFFDAGFRSFYTLERPINSPDDLAGLKIRVMPSKTATEMVNTLGGSANPIPWGELYSALQQGVVDGAENNPPSFFTSRHYEVCKYYSLNEHTALPDVLIMSTKAYESLNEEQKGWLDEAVEEAKVYQRKVWAEAEAANLKAVEEYGVTVLRPEKGPFMEKVNQMLENYKDDKILYDLIQQIQAVPDSM